MSMIKYAVGTKDSPFQQMSVHESSCPKSVQEQMRGEE